MNNQELARVLGITNAELKQLKDYVEHAEMEGWYYAPKHQFQRRHENIKAALNMGYKDTD